tara:strand:- start:43 stop:282 length:240 start_codon:yes stop_codon:yes gene_type:complete
MKTLRNFINEARKNEYIVWGVPEGEKDEKIMYTKAKNNNEAKKVVDILEKKHGVTKLRIQVLDLSQELTANDFKKALKR